MMFLWGSYAALGLRSTAVPQRGKDSYPRPFRGPVKVLFTGRFLLDEGRTRPSDRWPHQLPSFLKGNPRA